LRNTVDLHLHDSWEWGIKEDHKLLIRIIIQAVSCAVGAKRIVWVNARPGYEILSRLMDELDPGAKQRYLIREHGIDENICAIGKDLGKILKSPSLCLTPF
jgi:hypothetical protein